MVQKTVYNMLPSVGKEIIYILIPIICMKIYILQMYV